MSSIFLSRPRSTPFSRTRMPFESTLAMTTMHEKHYAGHGLFIAGGASRVRRALPFILARRRVHASWRTNAVRVSARRHMCVNCASTLSWSKACTKFVLWSLSKSALTDHTGSRFHSTYQAKSVIALYTESRKVSAHAVRISYAPPLAICIPNAANVSTAPAVSAAASTTAHRRHNQSPTPGAT